MAMEEDEIQKSVTEIFKIILDNENIVLTRETTANDIEEWDSLTHIQLIVGVEKKFDLRFTSAEIQNFQNIGEVCDCIKNKGGS